MRKRILALILALSLTAANAVTAFAEDENDPQENYESEKEYIDEPPVYAPVIVPGDVTGNGTVSIMDAIMLQKWLHGVQGAHLANQRAADLNGDGELDVFDMALLKKLLVTKEKPARLIAPPVQELALSMPSVGTDRIPVFAVSFPDCSFAANNTEALLQKYCFSGENEDDLRFYPRESIAAYFKRSSYGRLQLTGDVYSYTAAHPLDWYPDDGQALLQELLAAFDAQIDYQIYDTDSDQRLDAAVIVLPEAALEIDKDEDKHPDWWPFTILSTCTEQFDGLRAGTFCVVPFGTDRVDFVGKTAHELCHAMGLPDYYPYPNGDAYETEGMCPPAGFELMDEGDGDLSACSKLLLGWLSEDEVHVYTGGTQEYTLTSMQYEPNCILIPRDPEAGYLGEYFLIEYVTKEKNNFNDCGQGVRILHVQSEVMDGTWGKEFTYNIHSPYYDQSNRKQRILRLVNDYGRYYPDDWVTYTNRINGSIEGFHWYDEDGGLTVGTGIEVRISTEHPRPDWDESVFINPSSSFDYRNYPMYDWGTSHNVTISEINDVYPLPEEPYDPET